MLLKKQLFIQLLFFKGVCAAIFLCRIFAHFVFTFHLDLSFLIRISSFSLRVIEVCSTWNSDISKFIISRGPEGDLSREQTTEYARAKSIHVAPLIIRSLWHFSPIYCSHHIKKLTEKWDNLMYVYKLNYILLLQNSRMSKKNCTIIRNNNCRLLYDKFRIEYYKIYVERTITNRITFFF